MNAAKLNWEKDLPPEEVVEIIDESYNVGAPRYESLYVPEEDDFTEDVPK